MVHKIRKKSLPVCLSATEVLVDKHLYSGGVRTWAHVRLRFPYRQLRAVPIHFYGTIKLIKLPLICALFCLSFSLSLLPFVALCAQNIALRFADRLPIYSLDNCVDCTCTWVFCVALFLVDCYFELVSKRL